MADAEPFTVLLKACLVADHIVVRQGLQTV